MPNPYLHKFSYLIKFLLLVLLIVLSTSCGVNKKYYEARESRSIQLYEDYLDRYPKSKHYERASKELYRLKEERDWENAKSTNSINTYKRFLSNYPGTRYENDALERIERLQKDYAWGIAKSRNTIASYESFLESYPVSNYTRRAKEAIELLKDERSWRDANLKGTSQAYRKYISVFPDGKYRSEAYYKIKEIEVIAPEWNKISQRKIPEEFREFIQKYPNSDYSVKARRQLEFLDEEYWNRAERSNNLIGYKNYLKSFPKGRFKRLAEKSIIDLEVDDIFAGDYGRLPPMSRSGSGYSSSTTNSIEIKNNTAYFLTVRYSGSKESKRVAIPPRGKQSIDLPNGYYRVAASVNAANVNNYAGKENLVGGAYTSTFYIEYR